jgi:hypothetical protein
MKIKGKFTGINVLLVISVLVSGLAPLRARAAPHTQTNDPPYVIRGHVYEHDTTNGLWGARVEVTFETCDGGGTGSRTIVLPSTDSSGEWEFDERNYADVPCPGTPFTMTQRKIPTGYIAVRVQTPSDPHPIQGDTIVLTPSSSGTYDGNVFLDRHPYVVEGQAIDDDASAGAAGVEIAWVTTRGTFTTTTTAGGLWELRELKVR